MGNVPKNKHLNCFGEEMRHEWIKPAVRVVLNDDFVLHPPPFSPFKRLKKRLGKRINLDEDEGKLAM